MKNQKKAFEIEEITNYVRTKNQGETLTYKELQPFTHYNLEDELDKIHFAGAIMSRVREKLIEDGYILKAIKYQGFYILKSNQIQSYTYRTYIRRPLKQFQKAERILNNTIVNGLNNDELQKHKLTADLNKQLLTNSTEIIGLKKFKDLDL